MIPPLGNTGTLPLGRYLCTEDEIEAAFVLDEAFAASTSRRGCFDDWLKAKAMLDALAPAGSTLVEGAWVGGSFTTDKMDPDDFDCLFLISQEAFAALPSNNARNKVKEFNKKGRLRQKTGLRVDTFIMVRRPVALPWMGGGIDPAHGDYFGLRGAWDDWWLRKRTSTDKDALPAEAEAHPARGYLEVIWQ